MNTAGRTLTPKQLATALLVILLLIGATYGAYVLSSMARHKHVVQTSVRKALLEMKRQRAELEQAIEAYKQNYGFYPPSHTQPGQAVGSVNPLFYELVGTRRMEAQRQFFDRTQKEPIGV